MLNSIFWPSFRSIIFYEKDEWQATATALLIFEDELTAIMKILQRSTNPHCIALPPASLVLKESLATFSWLSGSSNLQLKFVKVFICWFLLMLTKCSFSSIESVESDLNLYLLASMVFSMQPRESENTTFRSPKIYQSVPSIPRAKIPSSKPTFDSYLTHLPNIRPKVFLGISVCRKSVSHP